MSLILVSDLINLSFIDLGVIAPGEGITTAEQADAFLRLNQLLAQLSTEQVSVYEVFHTSFALEGGVDLYTFGVGGTLGVPSIPVRVSGAASVQIPFRSPVQVVSHDALDAIAKSETGSTSVLAKVVAADNAWPLINIRVFPIPGQNPGTLWLDWWTALTAFAEVGTEVNLPPGYEKMLHTNLAVDLWPQYARPGNSIDILAALAQSSKQSIKDLYGSIQGMQSQPPPPPPPPPAQ